MNENEATLSHKDIVCTWERNDYDWEQEVLQGMKMKEGKLYVAYGGSYNRRGIWIWDTGMMKLIQNINFTEDTNAEFEDIEIYKGYLYLFVLDDYIMKFSLLSI